MSIRRHYEDGSVRARKLARRSYWPKIRRTTTNPVGAGSPFGYFFEDCRFNWVCTGTDPGTAPTGVINTTAFFYSPSGLYGQYYFISAAAARLGPRQASSGKGMTMFIDNGAGEGLEYVFGAASLAREAETSYVPGTTEDVFSRMTLIFNPGSAITDIHFGWRNTDFDFEVDYEDYTDLAAIDIKTNGAVYVETITNDLATVSTSQGFSLDNNLEHELKTVIKGGDCHFYVNGQECGPPFTMRDITNGAWVPFARFVQAGPAITLNMMELEIGTLKDLARGV